MRSEVLTFPLPPRRRVSGNPLGAMRARARGSGLDLAGARPYEPGDDVRRIDWRVSARLSSAHENDEFVVREHLTEESTRIVIAVDRSPSMALFPDDLPWLSKRAAVLEAGAMIVDSALEAGCSIGYLDDADDPGVENDDEAPRRRPPEARTETWRVRERSLPFTGLEDGAHGADRLLEGLLALDRPLPAGSFVFVLSDFLGTCPRTSPRTEAARDRAWPRPRRHRYHASSGASCVLARHGYARVPDAPGFSDRPLVAPGPIWDEALARGLDVVPVLVQDARWELSFPEVAGALLPLADPASGRVVPTRLTRAEVQARRERNEERFRAILARFDEIGADAVVLTSADRGDVLAAFLDWANDRHRGARLAR